MVKWKGKTPHVLHGCMMSIALVFSAVAVGKKSKLPKPAAHKPMNVIFILTDDHRFAFMGFTGKVPWLETPAMDQLAKQGVWVRNATVTTALCWSICRK